MYSYNTFFVNTSNSYGSVLSSVAATRCNEYLSLPESLESRGKL